ncbi:transglutaminase family protein [Seonamhaeicola sp. NFXS20]|uniref:transglutaminase family protein n=1 Tax=Seonamhaeicola sp. NFXS20 TaxID=2816959 RepID=UPI003B8D648C
MPKFYIKHLTKYTYSNLVFDGASQIMLYPIENEFQKVVSQKIVVNNNPKIETRTDFYGNTVGTFMIIEPHDYLSILSEVEVITNEIDLPNNSAPIQKQWEELKSLKHNPEFMDYLKYITFDGTDGISELIKTKDLNKISPYNIVLEFSEYIYNNFKYIKGVTGVDSKLDHVWKLKAGVCQDFTNILLQKVRMLGIPARYVSGYICPNEEGSRGEGATHAWVEAYIPFYGWLGIDPTNNTIANQFHVKLAAGKNYKDCAPVKGVFKGNVNDYLYVEVKVSSVKNGNDKFELPEEKQPNSEKNSYQKNLELIQQQQQQQ